jgi:hypothetical protein
LASGKKAGLSHRYYPMMKVRGISKHCNLSCNKIIPATKSFIAHDQVGRLGVHRQSLFILPSSNNEEIKKTVKKFIYLKMRLGTKNLLKRFF